MTRLRQHPLIAVAAAGLLAFALAACGHDGSDGIATANGGPASGAQPSPTQSLSPQDQALKFAQCMREHGVPMEDPDVNGDGGVAIKIDGQGIDPTKMEAAQEACRQYSPFGQGNQPAPDPAQVENLRRFAQCMRDNGVPNFPDPDGGMMRIDSSVGGDPDFPAAQEKCGKEFLPGGGSGPSSGGAGGGGGPQVNTDGGTV